MDNINHRGKGKTCLGFGKTEGKCTNQAGCKHSPYWCEKCNQDRMNYITNQLNRMVNGFD